MNPLLKILDGAHAAAAGKPHKALARTGPAVTESGFQGVLSKQLGQKAGENHAPGMLAKTAHKPEAPHSEAEAVKTAKVKTALKQTVTEVRDHLAKAADKDVRTKTGSEAEFLAAAQLHQREIAKPAAKPQAEAQPVAEALSKDGKLEKTAKRQTGAAGPGDIPTPDQVLPSLTGPTRKGRSQNGENQIEADERKLTVIDRRKAQAEEKSRTELASAVQAVPVEPKLNPAQPEVKSNEDIKIVFQTGNQIGAEGTGSRIEAPVTRDAAAQLARHLHDKANVQIVDTARFVLRDNNQGEIKLILHPESLGKVKINLNLSENSLEGRIVVENEMVRQVFQDNMDNLMQSFRDGGFQNLSLDVSVGGGQGQHREAANPGQLQSYGRSQNLSRDTADLPALPRLISGRTDSLIDVTV